MADDDGLVAGAAGGGPTRRTCCAALDRLEALRAANIPAEWGRRVHHNRLVQLAREGAATTVAHLRDLEPTRRYATLVAVVIEGAATLTDQGARPAHARHRLGLHEGAAQAP